MFSYIYFKKKDSEDAFIYHFQIFSDQISYPQAIDYAIKNSFNNIRKLSGLSPTFDEILEIHCDVSTFNKILSSKEFLDWFKTDKHSEITHSTVKTTPDSPLRGFTLVWLATPIEAVQYPQDNRLLSLPKF